MPAAPQPPMLTTYPNPPSCQALIIHYKYEVDTHYL